MRQTSPARPRGRARIGLLALVLGLASAAGCRLSSLEKNLSPAQADFLSKVRYIITGEERKIFLELPPSEREAFVEEFWRRRDPSPDTDVNEYRLEYEARVERATVLFHGEGRPGWQTDRGRIFILFGPPMERQTFPMDAGGFCREVWYYGSFPVIFVDAHCSGSFALTAMNLEHLQKLNIAQGYFQKASAPEKRFFDYEAAVEKVRAGPGVYEGKVVVDVPYGSVRFPAEEETLETAFDVRLELADESGLVLWRGGNLIPLKMHWREYEAMRSKRLRMEFPFTLTEGLDRLRGQKVVLIVVVRSSSGGEELRKSLRLRLKF